MRNKLKYVEAQLIDETLICNSHRNNTFIIAVVKFIFRIYTSLVSVFVKWFLAEGW